MIDVVMTAEHKQFITEQLIPFILREQGNGFAMDWWHSAWPRKGDLELRPLWYVDDVVHTPPACNTVCCIGGSIEHLLEFQPRSVSEDHVGSLVGLSPARSKTLFYGYMGTPTYTRPQLWPEPWITRYAQAQTALEKAQVAVSLLRTVVETDGAILDTGKKYTDLFPFIPDRF